MREKFENRRLKGTISVVCKYENAPSRTWTADKGDTIARILAIVKEYTAQGLPLTLRQLHYQMVVNNWIINHDTAYKKLGSILDDCRYAGLVDWDAIEDRGRIPFIPYAVRDVDHAMQDTIDQYRLDRQLDQENQIELWTEKDALSGILRIVTSQYHIRLVVNKGYSSSSAMYKAYQRILAHIVDGKKVTVLYFGDHDPSGLDMVRDIKERIMFFLSRGSFLYDAEDHGNAFGTWWDANGYTLYDLIEGGYCDESIMKLLDRENEKLEADYEAGRIRMYIEEKQLFTVKHIGLTKEQIAKYKLPPNPTKMTDTRAAEYVQEHGKTCWEVDALKPQVLIQLVRSFIEGVIDMDMYNDQLALEKVHIAELKKFFNK